MSLTYTTPDNIRRHNLGDRFYSFRDILFDSAYPSGGYSVTPAKAGFDQEILGAVCLGFNAAQPAGIALPQWDVANSKVLVPSTAPPELFKIETVTVASHVGRLARVPGYIVTARASAGGTTGALRIIPVGETPATGQVAVNFATGALTFATADAVTAAIFTYIPLGVGPFIEANRVVDESNAGANDTTRDLANRAGLIQYIWNDTAGTLPTLIPVGESPGSGEAAVDFDNSGATTITVNAAQDDATYKITYWKHSALTAYGWTDQADIAVTSNVAAFGEIFDTGAILIPSYGNVIVAEATATNKQAIAVDRGGSAAANVAVYDPILNKLTFDNGDSITTAELAYILLSAAQMGANGETVPVGANLSSLNCRFMFIGR